jgi:hypothetical protein
MNKVHICGNLKQRIAVVESYIREHVKTQCITGSNKYINEDSQFGQVSVILKSLAISIANVQRIIGVGTKTRFWKN